MNPAMQGARANAAASEAIKTAAGNEAGAMTGFMGMGMLNQGGAMFGANVSAQSQAGQTMDTMNVVGGGVATPAPEPAVEEAKPEGVACPKCGATITGKFCNECGEPRPEEPQEKVCPKCGEKVDPNAKFCMSCGEQL